jgi:hypothetical protein
VQEPVRLEVHFKKYWWHLTAPIISIVYLRLFSLEPDDSTQLLFLIANVLFISLPYLLWFAMCKDRFRPHRSTLFGFIGAHVSLLLVTLLISNANAEGTPESGNGWMFYYPLAFILVFLFSKFGDLLQR